ncbi:MAG: NYN domain-containing protein [Tissierellia bacterium]|nr:NYN domain-containing protein [Tissierellia bacterium]
MAARKSRRYDKGKSYLFVDGYNIINHWAELKEEALENFEEARRSLADQLADYAHYTGVQVILVYDAYRVVSGTGSHRTYKGIDLVYTKENETADHYIEREIHKLDGRTQNIRVATSDNLEQQMILAGGASRVSARELMIEIDQVKGRLASKLTDLKVSPRPISSGWDPKAWDQLKTMKRLLEEKKDK